MNIGLFDTAIHALLLVDELGDHVLVGTPLAAGRTCMHMHTHACTCTRTCMHMHTHMHAHIHAHACVQVGTPSGVFESLDGAASWT